MYSDGMQDDGHVRIRICGSRHGNCRSIHIWSAGIVVVVMRRSYCQGEHEQARLRTGSGSHNPGPHHRRRAHDSMDVPTGVFRYINPHSSIQLWRRAHAHSEHSTA